MMANISLDEGQVRKTLEDKFKLLERTIDPNNSFLDHFCILWEPFNECRSVIDSKVGRNAKTAELLKFLKKNTSCIEKFLYALRENGQSHVAYIFTGQEDKTPMDKEDLNKLNDNESELYKYLDPHDGFLLELKHKKVLMDDDIKSISQIKDLTKQSKELVEIMKRKWQDSLQVFIETLGKTGQEHVATILTDEGPAPLADIWREKICEEMSFLKDRMRLDTPELLSKLIAKGVFSHDYDKERIKEPEDSSERCDMLLELLRRKSQRAFFDFLEVLDVGNVDKVVRRKFGVLVYTKVELVGPIEPSKLKKVEEKIVHMIFRNARFQRVLERIGVSLYESSKGCIKLSFLCSSRQTLQSFKNLCNSGELDEILSESYCPMFPNTGRTGFHINLSDEEFDRCCKMLDDELGVSKDLKDKLKDMKEELNNLREEVEKFKLRERLQEERVEGFATTFSSIPDIVEQRVRSYLKEAFEGIDKRREKRTGHRMPPAGSESYTLEKKQGFEAFHEKPLPFYGVLED